MTKNDKIRRSVGRPPVDKPMRQVTFRISDELLEAVDAVVEDRDGGCDRSAVMREAIAKGLRLMR